MRYRLLVEYDGTEFHGWQRQPGLRTVQATLEDALARFLGDAACVAAAGRTDAGVDASGQVVSLASDRGVARGALCRALNALKADDVAVRDAETVPEEF